MYLPCSEKSDVIIMKALTLGFTKTGLCFTVR